MNVGNVVGSKALNSTRPLVGSLAHHNTMSGQKNPSRGSFQITPKLAHGTAIQPANQLQSAAGIMMGSDLQSSYQTAPSCRKLPLRIVNADLRSSDLQDGNNIMIKANEADDMAPEGASQMLLINEQQQASVSIHQEGGSRDTDSRRIVKENSHESSIKQVAGPNNGFYVNSTMDRRSQETMHFTEN